MPNLVQTLSVLCARISYKGVVRKASSDLQDHLDKFQDDSISKKTFISRVQKTLNDAYLKAYQKGGGVKSPSEAGQTWLDEFKNGQFSFLKGFADDVESGSGVMEPDMRMGMYAKAIKPAYHAGSLHESDDGSEWNWDLGPGENCEDCVSNAEGGPYSADDLPGLPGDGQTVCGPNCNCSIVKSGR